VKELGMARWQGEHVAKIAAKLKAELPVAKAAQ